MMHLAVELGFVAVAALAVLTAVDAVELWLGCLLGWTLLTLAWVDWEHMMLPDVLTLPLVLAGLGATLLTDPQASWDHAGGAGVGYLAFRAIEIGYRSWRGRDGLGQGDAKLMAAAGAWLGLAPLPTVVVTAAVLGLAMAAALRLSGRVGASNGQMPFGPALCIAIWAAWLGWDPPWPAL